MSISISAWLGVYALLDHLTLCGGCIVLSFGLQTGLFLSVSCTHETLCPCCSESSVFTTEVDILEHMRGCPFIVQLFGICVDRHFNALVLEYASKGDLHCFLTRSMQTEAVGEEGQLARSWTFRRRVIFQIALGMQYLHSHNVMHRDLKSGNVYLDSRYDCKASCNDMHSRLTRLTNSVYV